MKLKLGQRWLSVSHETGTTVSWVTVLCFTHLSTSKYGLSLYYITWFPPFNPVLITMTIWARRLTISINRGCNIPCTCKASFLFCCSTLCDWKSVQLVKWTVQAGRSRSRNSSTNHQNILQMSHMHAQTSVWFTSWLLFHVHFVCVSAGVWSSSFTQVCMACGLVKHSHTRCLWESINGHLEENSIVW